jgi:hypothetical protein
VAAQMSESLAGAATSAGSVRAVVAGVDKAAQENREVARMALGTAQRVAAELERVRELLREFSA